MSLISDRIQKVTKARRWRDGHEPSWVTKAEFPNADSPLPSNVPDDPVQVGTLRQGDAFAFADGSGHGIVTGKATGLGMTMVDAGIGNCYIASTRLVIPSAAEANALG
jgi:hypothetical protein